MAGKTAEEEVPKLVDSVGSEVTALGALSKLVLAGVRV